MELWESEIGDTNGGYYFSVEKKQKRIILLLDYIDIDYAAIIKITSIYICLCLSCDLICCFYFYVRMKLYNLERFLHNSFSKCYVFLLQTIRIVDEWSASTFISNNSSFLSL